MCRFIPVGIKALFILRHNDPHEGGFILVIVNQILM